MSSIDGRRSRTISSTLRATYAKHFERKRAIRLIIATEEPFSFLAGSPQIGMRCFFDSPPAHDLRWWRAKAFDKHLVFDRPIDQGIDVICALHTARDWEAVFRKCVLATGAPRPNALLMQRVK